MITRRYYLRALGLAVVAPFAPQEPQGPQPQARGFVDTSNLFEMNQDAARTVRLPAKPNTTPSVSVEERDALEHRIRCQCGCTLDVYTCRTTDFTCQVSPAMHRDVIALVEGGYTAREILDAFVNVYGERVLMAPPREGFNLLGYVVPGVLIGIGAVLLVVLLRRWKRPAPAVSGAVTRSVDATPEEMARLESVIRDDS